MTEYSLLVENTGNKKDVNSLYLFNLYYYYHNRGYSNLLLTEITNLIVLIYIVFLIIFSVQCVNFEKLVDYNIKERISLSNFVNLHDFWNFNPFIIICLVLFSCYVIVRLVSMYASVKKFWKIRKIYKEDLGIDSGDLENLSWNEISTKIIKYYCDPNLNAYTMALKIMTKENLIISIYNELEELKFNNYPLTKLLEWNFIFCFINPLINENREIDSNVKIDSNIYYNKVISNLKKVTIINLIFLPFLLIFMVLYMILQYGEKFYNNPKLIVNRQWSLRASWKLRYYNELPHLFHNRMEKAGQLIKDYDKQFPSRLYETVGHFLTFIIGSLFIILLILTILNENLLINLNISSNRPILWYMGILGGILSITKSFIDKNFISDPEKSLKKVNELIDMDDEWIKDARNRVVRNKIMKLFPQRVILLLEECYCLIITPYILWFILKKEAVIICNYLINSLNTHHSVNGLVNKNSLFINYSQIKENNKTEKSFECFQKNYPEWGFSSFMYNQDTYYPNNSEINKPSTIISPLNSNLNTIMESKDPTTDMLVNF